MYSLVFLQVQGLEFSERFNIMFLGSFFVLVWFSCKEIRVADSKLLLEKNEKIGFFTSKEHAFVALAVCITISRNYKVSA